MRHVVVTAGLLRQGRAALDAKAHEGPARELDGHWFTPPADML